MKLKLGTLTPEQYQHLQRHGWVQLPAESPRHKQKRAAGKVRSAKRVGGRVLGEK